MDIDEPDKFGITPLVAAIRSGNSQVTKQLVENGADVNSLNPVFELVCRLGRIEGESEEWEELQEVLDEMMAKGADVTQLGPDGYSAYDVALCIGDKEVATLLDLAGADPQDSYALHALLSILCGNQVLDGGGRLGSPTRLTSPGAPGSPTSRKASSFSTMLNIDLSVLEEGSEQLDDFKHSFHSTLSEVFQVDPKMLKIETIAPADDGASVEFTVKSHQVKPATMALRLNTAYRDFQDPMYRTVLDECNFKDWIDVDASLARCLPQRVKYLEDTALELMNKLPSGAYDCLGKPPTAPEGTPSPLMLAATSGRGFIARAIIAHSGHTMTTDDAEELMLFYDNILADQESDAGVADPTLVDELVMSVVNHSELTRSDQAKLLKIAVKTGLERTVVQLLKLGAPLGGGLLQKAIKMLGKVPHLPYVQITCDLLEAGADPNEVYEDITPLVAALGGNDRDAWPYRSLKQVEAVSMLVRYGAKFNPQTFVKALAEWDLGTTDDKRTKALEECIAEMVKSGVDYSLCTRGKSVIDVAVELKSLKVLSAVLDAQGKRFDEKLMEQFGKYDTDGSGALSIAELVDIQGAEAGGSLFENIDKDGDQEITKEEWLSYLISPMQKLFLDVCFDNDVEDDVKLAHFKAKLCNLLIHARMPALHRLVEKTDIEQQHIPVDIILQMYAEDDQMKRSITETVQTTRVHLQFLDTEDPYGTVLHIASRNGLDEVVSALLDCGADFDIMDNTGETPLGTAVKFGQPECMRVLMEHGAKLQPGMLTRSGLADDLPTVKAVLDAGADVDERNHFQRTALHACGQAERIVGGKSWYNIPTYHDSAQVATAMVQHGATVDARDLGGETPLAIACQNKRENVGEVLLENHAQPLLQDRTGRTPLSRAIAAGCGSPFIHHMIDCSHHPNISKDPYVVFNAIQHGNLEIARRLFHTDNELHLYRGWPAVWWACFFSIPGMESELLSLGKAGALWKDQKERSLLHWLAIGWQPRNFLDSPRSLIVPLLSAGVRLLDQDSTNRTALELAAEFGNSHMVKTLLDLNGATAESREKALRAAQQNGFQVCAAILADLPLPDLAGDSRTAAGLNQPFVDPEFPPVLKSLTREGTHVPPTYCRVEWIRASQYCSMHGERRLFPQDAITENAKVECGVAGSPWFWATVTTAGDTVIRGLFNQPGENPNGVYKITCLRDGAPETVIIDDFIPCIDGSPAFGQVGEETDMWSLLLCKACAKLCGSYADLVSRDSSTSSWCQDAAAKLNGMDALFAMQVAPLLSLADQLHNSCVAPVQPHSDAADFVQSLAQTLLADADQIPKPLNPVHSERPPDFMIKCGEETEVSIVIVGRIPADLVLEIERNDGELVASFNASQLESDSACRTLLQPENGPYRVITDTEATPDDMENLDYEFLSGKDIEVWIEDIDAVPEYEGDESIMPEGSNVQGLPQQNIKQVAADREAAAERKASEDRALADRRAQDAKLSEEDRLAAAERRADADRRDMENRKAADRKAAEDKRQAGDDLRLDGERRKAEERRREEERRKSDERLAVAKRKAEADRDHDVYAAGRLEAERLEAERKAEADRKRAKAAATGRGLLANAAKKNKERKAAEDRKLAEEQIRQQIHRIDGKYVRPTPIDDENRYDGDTDGSLNFIEINGNRMIWSDGETESRLELDADGSLVVVILEDGEPTSRTQVEARPNGDLEFEDGDLWTLWRDGDGSERAVGRADDV